MQEAVPIFLPNGVSAQMWNHWTCLLFLNFLTITFKCHMSNVIYDTFLCPHLSSKGEPPITIVDQAVTGKCDDILSFRSRR